MAVAVEAGILPPTMLATAAVAVAGSLIIASPFALRGDALYRRWREPLRRWQRTQRLPGDEDLHLHPVEVMVFGLGRLGTAAMATVELEFPGSVLGVDVDPRIVAEKHAQGHYVVTGDATDAEFWSRTENQLGELEWVLLTMSSHEANLTAVERLRDRGFTGRLVATSRYADQALELRAAGANTVFDVYTEAGTGFASDIQRRLNGYETGMLQLGAIRKPPGDAGAKGDDPAAG